MTHRPPASRTLEVGGLARVEGEGGLRIEVADGQVVDVQLRIYEPPRFFEAFLRGRSYTEPPDLTARICGICPVAYQMSACRAIEAACGVVVDGPLRELRRLLYAGEWIESHALHVVMLHAPDFLGYESAIAMAADHRDLVEEGLALKKAGNELLELVGGRAVHPVNVRVGGFHRAPTRRELRAFRPQLEAARDLAAALVRRVAAFDVPEIDGALAGTTLVALSHPTEYAVLDGRVVSSRGLDIDDAAFGDAIRETQVPHSTALHAHLVGGGAGEGGGGGEGDGAGEGAHHLVGPIARWALNGTRMGGAGAELAAEVGLERPLTNPARSVVVRAVEVLHACDEAIAIIDAYEEPDAAAVPVEPRDASGGACTEAPRGLLFHRYALDADGTVTDAVIVPPTAQNQPTIEHDLWHLVEAHHGPDGFDVDDDELARRCERAIRHHDPCISCATHFLDLVIEGR